MDNQNGIIVNPWLKSKTLKRNIVQANLFDFYKCMHPNCIFSTNEKSTMQYHSNDHYIHIDIKKYLNCPYCSLGPAYSAYDLLHHMETTHSRCTYQCSYCYYRCIEMDSIVLHYEKFHPNNEKKVYVVNNQQEFGLDQIERMHEGKLKNSKTKIQKINQFHEFECSYCNVFESSDINEIRDHLAENHNSEFMFMMRRGETDKYIYFGAMLSERTNFKFFKCEAYKPMSRYFYLEQQNLYYQPNPIPLVPVSKTYFQFKPSTLRIAENVQFVYQTYADYKKSQTLLFQCGEFRPEYLLKYPHKRGFSCRLCRVFFDQGIPDRHLTQHRQTHCYFIAENENLIMRHMVNHYHRRYHYYRKVERKKNSCINISIKCSFVCGICPDKVSSSVRLAWEHHKTYHKDDAANIQIEKYLDEKKITSNEYFVLRTFEFCMYKSIEECSRPMNRETLVQHHKQYHADSNELQVRCKLFLCKNDEILSELSNETEKQYIISITSLNH